MIRKLLIGVSFAALTLIGTSGRVLSDPAEQQAGKQTQQASKTVSGKVTSIGNSGLSFAMEVDEGGNKRTMQFVVDKKTQVQGTVKAGTMVTVEYQPTEGGQNLALIVTAQSS